MARDIKTEPASVDVSHLPELTQKQLGFVQGLLSGLSASDAYRQAYDCEAMSKEATWVEASRLKADPNIALWLDRVRQDMLADTKITLESHTRELLRLAKAAEGAGNYGAAAKCTELTGRANGLYVDRIETKDTTDQAAAVLAKLSPELQALLAPFLGISEASSSPEEETQH